MSFPERYHLPGRPTGAAPAVQDAHRQTEFLLGEELTPFERAMNLQLQIVAANAKNRTPQAGALLAFWARVFAYLADACSLVSLGSYVSCPPLLRAACDCVAAQRSLLAGGFDEYEQWLGSGFGQDRERQALSIELGRFRAGSLLAKDEGLGPLYRLLTDLSMPHFGATVVQTAPDSSVQRLGLVFADGAFHLGWAELIAGGLLTLAAAQLETAAGSGVLPVPEALAGEWQQLKPQLQAAAANPRRCRAEAAGDRFLFHNFRRAATGQPRRLLLG